MSDVDNAVIRVIGLGGAGNNAVNRMIETGFAGVEFIAANTDAQVLATSLADTRLQLGDHLTKGLGAGANPEVGEKAALEDRDRLVEVLDGSDMVFLTAGMGGGTGTGSAPVVAEVAREAGALTVAIVTTPFAFEGPKRSRQAQEGLRKLERNVDALIVVENERLMLTLDRKTTMKEAFRVADHVLYQGVRGITDVINSVGFINVDFADVKTVLTGAGTVLMGVGTGSGDDRAEQAAMSATRSALLARGVEGSHELLVNVASSDDLTNEEVREIVRLIVEATEVEDPNMLFGLSVDPSLVDEVRVTVIAAGFDVPSTARVLRPSQLRPTDASTTYDPANYDIPAFLRYKSDDE